MIGAPNVSQNSADTMKQPPLSSFSIMYSLILTVTVAVVASIGTPGGIKALRSFSAPNEGRKSLLLYSGNIELFFIFTQATYHLKTQCASSTATAKNAN